MVAPTEPRGWIGVDFDGTLADYSQGWRGAGHLGAPVPLMLDRVKRWLAEGRQVRVFTARCWPVNDVPEAFDIDYARSTCDDAFSSQPEKAVRVAAALETCDRIAAWCEVFLGKRLHITCIKDMNMIELYDDRCVQVIANTGQLVGQSSRGVPA